MKLASWNIRGVNKPFKQQEVRSLVFSNNISLFGLNETRVHQDNCSRVAEALLKGWKVLVNYNYHPNGRICVFWNSNLLDVYEVFVSAQMVHVQVTIIQKQVRFLASFIYGLHTRREQYVLWNSLNHISLSASHAPWIVLGDVSVVRRPEERFGGEMSWANSSKDLERCCYFAQLEDLRYSGQQFTWSKREGHSFIARKMDRVLVNPMWMTVFDGLEARFLEPCVSYHSPMVVQLGLALHH